MKQTKIRAVSTKRAAQIPVERSIKQQIYDLGDTRCEYCHMQPIADRGHEIKKRSHCGSPIDPFNIIQLCLYCHKREHGEYEFDPPKGDLLFEIVRPLRLAQGFRDLSQKEGE